jgi:enolase
VIANHILVSFHVAFISSVLALPAAAVVKGEVLRFIFVSHETLVSALFLYVTFHTGIALHEMGHLLKAARLSALKESVLEEIEASLGGSMFRKLAFYAKVFILAPYGKAAGIRREGLNYYPDAPYNLAVAAAGPEASRNVARVALPPAVVLLAVGLGLNALWAIYAGRLLLGVGVVTLLDFLLADPGKYKEFREQEQRARESAERVTTTSDWYEMAPKVKELMLTSRMQEVTHPRLGPVTAPWQFRNCGMGGRHTEKEYPESNISMQEAMFLILGAHDYQEAQEMTVRLQNRLKEIIEKEEGGRVMGIGLEGGLAPYIEKGDYPLPEVRLWAMMKQAMEECAFRPGVDVAIALDPAMSELEIAYRREFNMPDAVGTYLFWRDKAKIVMDRDGVLDIYLKAIHEYGIPIASLEDGFSENDDEGWKKVLEAVGDRIFIIGDDLVTTNDCTIEACAGAGLINTALIKANQIGTLSETLLAMTVALGKGLDLVISHRSKSPNDDMEAHIALAANALGLKAGGGANTERLVKYQSVAELLGKAALAEDLHALREDQQAVIQRFYSYEEPTNAGIPTVGTTAELLLPDSGVLLRFRGATPLGTSAGTGEALHLVDSLVESAEYREVITKYTSLFREVEPGVHAFRREVRAAQVREIGDEALSDLFCRAERYQGKGCLNAVNNVLETIARSFGGRDVARMSLRDIDSMLLGLEVSVARRRGKLRSDASVEECIAAMQRKQNLGMNAVLSVSLALARAAAHVRGKELYEVLREEMLATITHLTDKYGVQIPGSRFSDYVTALREVNEVLEAQATPLHEALREVSGIYATDTVPAG